MLVRLVRLAPLVVVFAACATVPSPTPTAPPSATPAPSATIAPSIACDSVDEALCQGAAAAVIASVRTRGTVAHVEIGNGGCFSPLEPCPVPVLANGTTWIGHAIVSFLPPVTTTAATLVRQTNGEFTATILAIPAITADQARAVALREAAGTNVTVVSAETSIYGAWSGPSFVDPQTVVWAVRLSGTFPPPSCGGLTATPHPCPPPASSELILIDAASGAFIEGDVPAP